MRAGTLRHTVAIQESTETASGMGDFTTTWATVSGMGSVPASIWPIRATERIDAMKMESMVTHRVRIRYRSGVTSKMRIYWADKSKTFQIIGTPINPDERNIYLEMIVTEEV